MLSAGNGELSDEEFIALFNIARNYRAENEIESKEAPKTRV